MYYDIHSQQQVEAIYLFSEQSVDPGPGECRMDDEGEGRVKPSRRVAMFRRA